MEVDYFMQHVHSHSFNIQIIKKTSKINKKCFNEVALMQRKYFDKWIATVTC